MKTPLMIAIVTAACLVLGRAQEASESPAAETAPQSSAAEAPKVIQADDSAGLEANVGSEVIVEGVVKSVGKTSGGGLNFINFGDRKTGFTAIVFSKSMSSFPEGLDKYSGQKVRVRGKLEKFQDRQIQVQITTPDQLEVVASAP